jgi:hypothetical protein
LGKFCIKEMFQCLQSSGVKDIGLRPIGQQESFLLMTDSSGEGTGEGVQVGLKVFCRSTLTGVESPRQARVNPASGSFQDLREAKMR